MVSRYGVAKEGAVGVAVGVGPMHCLLPHCGGPHHHLSPHHPQNPNHNHLHTHNHQSQPSQQPLSPHSPHIGQMNHGQHQLTINIGHHHPQQQQQQSQGQHQQPPPQYRIVTGNPRWEYKCGCEKPVNGGIIWQSKLLPICRSCSWWEKCKINQGCGWSTQYCRSLAGSLPN